MRRFQTLLLAVFCLVIFSGCGAAEVERLKAQLAQAEAAKARLEAENAKLAADLASVEQERQQVAGIKKGYEEARGKFASQLKGLAPLLGEMASPLPPFENLADSSWVGKLAPGAKMPPDMKELEGALKGLLGDQGAKPAP